MPWHQCNFRAGLIRTASTALATVFNPARLFRVAPDLFT